MLIADDEVAHRRAVREALEADGFVVVGEVGDAASAIGAATRLQPDICLIEIELPARGAERDREDRQGVARDADRRAEPIGRPGGRGDRVHARRLRLPAEGVSGDRLATTLRGAYAGSRRCRGRSSPTSSARSGAARLGRLTLPDGPVTLTPREWEVGELLRDGQSTGEIAERLGVSPVTVRRHVGLLLQQARCREPRRLQSRLLRAYGRAEAHGSASAAICQR